MAVMSLDVPMLALAQELNNTLSSSGATCYEFYTESLGLTDEMAGNLCTNSVNFTFAD